MQPDLWHKTSELLLEALKRDPVDRSRYLDRVCQEDESLRREVESLLCADPEILARIDRPAFRWFSPALDELQRDRQIGPYRILRELGRGGTGVVHLGERADGEDRRQVAIKVLRPGMDTNAITRRFGKEGQILGRLEHPNIAQLYGGGTTEDRRPYLVMEYVEGEPLDRYCETRKLPLRERVEVFRKVCSAVQYAHQHLVVHRDLKPSNIVVTSQGEPKLLDFGISKLLDPGTHLPNTVTAHDLRLLTPDYASPEQVRSEAVTTASDVYSLGVVLYELLSGHHPYELKSRDEPELRRVICHTEPERPSTLVQRRRRADSSQDASGGLMPQQASRIQEGDLRKLSRRLRGDLDNIVLMALRKEPKRRYPSVEQLSEDLGRYLEGRPVRARKASFAYRAEKLLARRKRELVVASVLLFLVGGFLVDRELQQRETIRERDKAQQVSEFLLGLFGQSDPSAARGREITVREVLDSSAGAIDELEGQPELQAAFMNTIGRVYRNLGHYAAASPLLEGALSRRRRVHGARHLEVAGSLAEFAALRRAQGDYEAAELLLREALAVRKDLLGEDHELVARSFEELATVLQDRGVYDEAETFYRRSVVLKRGLLGEGHPAVARSLNSLSALLVKRGDYEAAEPLLQQALAVRRRHFDGDHPDVSDSLNNLGGLHWAREDYARAEALYREALAMRQRLFAGDHEDVATSLNNLATLYHNQARYDAAEPLYRQSLAMSRRLTGNIHPDTAQTLANFAGLHMERGNLETAEPLLRESLAIQKQLLGEDHPDVATTQLNLGSLQSRRRGYEEAESLYRQALATRKEHLGEGHAEVAIVARFLAKLLLQRGELAEAESLSRKAVHTLRRELPAHHWRTAQAEATLGGCLSELGRYAEAETLLVGSNAVLRAEKGPDSRVTLAAIDLLVSHYEHRGMMEEAAKHRSLLTGRP